MIFSAQMRSVLQGFSALPAAERFHVWARAFSCPMEAVAAQIPSGKVLEVGCGHGLFSALLAQDPQRQVKGIDPDPRKIALAGTLATRPGLSFALGSIEEEPERDFDAIAILDVLYLVPREQWPGFLRACADRLSPRGRLVVKEVGTEPKWKHRKAYLQEVVMVRALGRTHGSAIEIAPAKFTADLLTGLGFRVAVTDVSKGYTTPHVMFVATRG